jgi:signal transduction histidine kinase
MSTFIDNMVTTVQQISAELRPAILDDLGLEAAIESQVHDFSRWNGCRVSLDLDIAGLKPSRDRDTAVFRIVQEALTNVVRHAEADKVSVRASMAGGELLVEIADDGCGIAESKWTSSHSLGLIGMRERAERFGGRLTVQRRVEDGTLVRLRVPLARTSSG